VGSIRSRLGQTEAAEEAYRRAVEILSALAADRPAEPVHREALAQAHLELSAVFGDQLHRDEAEGEIKTAAALWETLARKEPEVGRYRSKLADAHSSLGYMYTHSERYGGQPRNDEAETEIRQALDAVEPLAREHPEVSAYQASLATILQRRALLQERSDRSRAEESYKRVVEITGNLARSHPKRKDYQYLFANFLSTQGTNLTRMGKLPQAQEAFKESIAVWEKLGADHPQDIRIAYHLGQTYLFYQEFLISQGQGESALELSGRTIRLFRSLASRDSTHLENREELWVSIAERGETLMRLGRHTEARADFEELVQSAQVSPSIEVYRAFHALTKARLGDLSALTHIEDMVRDILRVSGFESDGRYNLRYFDAACLQAGLAKLALEAREPLLAEQRRLAQRDLDRALELLDKARAAGEFKGIISLSELRRETLLDPVRSNPRFQLLMMDLAFPDIPFAADGDRHD
jgi:tetratricopeptide (TPR) repeat protein